MYSRILKNDIFKIQKLTEVTQELREMQEETISK